MRDRGFSKKPKSLSKNEERAQKLASKAAKAELNSLFSNSKLSKEKASRLEEIQAQRGKPAYYQKLDDYYRDYGLPLEWDLQLLFLDHRNKQIVVEVLQSFLKTASTMDLSKQDLLASKLNVMEVSTFDPDVSAAIRLVKSSLLRK